MNDTNPAGGAGQLITCEVEQIANGGHCVARQDGQVVFVRYALPGEQVRAKVTSGGRGFLRAEVVEVLRPAPERVTPPCPYFGHGGCGGCDFQHIAPQTQRQLKAQVITEQLRGVPGLPRLRVRELSGGMFGWRTRVRYTADQDGQLGLLRHRSHDVVPVDRCLIAHQNLQDLPLTSQLWAPGAVVEAVQGSSGQPVVLRPQRPSRSGARGRAPAGTRAEPAPTVTQEVGGRRFVVAADGFWQIHPEAAETLSTTVLEQLDPQPGERAWDLYGGAGLFAAAIAERVGPQGRVSLVESDPRGTAAARHCLRDLPQVRVVRETVTRALDNPSWRQIDLVVADPPRTGLGAQVVEKIVARQPRAVSYVSCDPATFARDVRAFGEAGYELTQLAAFDAFPNTQHVEVVGRLSPRS